MEHILSWEANSYSANKNYFMEPEGSLPYSIRVLQFSVYLLSMFEISY
jgi:hypothetical protein